jgi:hypothetical protein
MGAPLGWESVGSTTTQTTFLPPFSSFLYATKPADEKLAPTTFEADQGYSGPPQARTNSLPLGYSTIQSRPNGTSEHNTSQTTDQLACTRRTPLGDGQSPYWPYSYPLAIPLVNQAASLPGLTRALPLECNRRQLPVGEEKIFRKSPPYIYNHRSDCQIIVSGEAGNSRWGTTRADKQRKRLVQACNRCREKKIKCDHVELGSKVLQLCHIFRLLVVVSVSVSEDYLAPNYSIYMDNHIS